MSQVAEFNFVIVGAGSAGCLLANRLSANPDRRVLLIEAGGKDDWFWIKVPVGYLYTIANPRTDWCFTTEPDPGLAGRSIHYARGRVIGGCSSINAMIHMRGQASDYDLWAQATGDERWLWGGSESPGETLAIYKKLEDYFGGADDWHGVGGEIRVERPRVRWKILDAWQAAAAQVDIAPNDEFNRGDNSGSAYFHVNQRRGRRWSMADAFLHPIARRPNPTVYTQTQALRLVMDDQVHEDQRRGAWTTAQQRVTGLQLLRDGQIVEVGARQEVILSAGAVGSPHLMQVSGLGPADRLAQHQVPVAVDLPGVGENLQDHLQLRTVYRIWGAPTVNTLYRNWISRAGMGLQYLLSRSGPMTMPPSTLGAFAKSDPSLSNSDLEWHVQPLSLPKFGEPLHPFGAITPSVCNLRPSSRGHVRMASPDPLTYPKISCNYLSTDADRRIAVKGLRMTRQIMAAPALAPYGPQELLPGPQPVSDEDLQKAAGELGTTIFHPVGTCAMGNFDARGRPRSAATVLDTDCRVYRVAGLRVVDASAIPTIISGNTNAPVMLIAERAARAILDKSVNTGISICQAGIGFRGRRHVATQQPKVSNDLSPTPKGPCVPRPTPSRPSSMVSLRAPTISITRESEMTDESPYLVQQGEAQTAVVRALFDSLPPSGWVSCSVEYRKAGRVAESQVNVTSTNGATEVVKSPHPMIAALKRLRGLMASQGRGAWLSVTLTAASDGKCSFDFTTTSGRTGRCSPPTTRTSRI